MNKISMIVGIIAAFVIACLMWVGLFFVSDFIAQKFNISHRTVLSNTNLTIIFPAVATLAGSFFAGFINYKSGWRYAMTIAVLFILLYMGAFFSFKKLLAAGFICLVSYVGVQIGCLIREMTLNMTEKNI